MTPDEHRERLRELGDAYLAADEARTKALVELGTAMREAEGVTPTEMGTLGRVSRVTAYRLLETPKAPASRS